MDKDNDPTNKQSSDRNKKDNKPNINEAKNKNTKNEKGNTELEMNQIPIGDEEIRMVTAIDKLLDTKDVDEDAVWAEVGSLMKRVQNQE